MKLHGDTGGRGLELAIESFSRLEMGADTDEDLIELLTTYLKLDPHDIYEYQIPLNLGRLWDIVTEESLAHLTLPTYTPKSPSTG